MSILTKEQTQEILNGAMEQIKQAVINNAIKEASWKIQVALNDAVSGVVKTFVQEEVAPELLTSLTENKSALISAAITSAESMAIQLAKAMSAELADNLGSSYGRKKILEAMFD